MLGSNLSATDAAATGRWVHPATATTQPMQQQQQQQWGKAATAARRVVMAVVVMAAAIRVIITGPWWRNYMGGGGGSGSGGMYEGAGYGGAGITPRSGRRRWMPRTDVDDTRDSIASLNNGRTAVAFSFPSGASCYANFWDQSFGRCNMRSSMRC